MGEEREEVKVGMTAAVDAPGLDRTDASTPGTCQRHGDAVEIAGAFRDRRVRTGPHGSLRMRGTRPPSENPRGDPLNVLIVESAAKARTLQKYLGGGWAVLATGGHVETLPEDRRKHGSDAGKAFWTNRPGELPSPPWVWTERGEKAVADIVEAGGDDPAFWIATDPDREGEFIAWSLERRLKRHGPTHRVSFQEVTEEALRAALANPRPVDARMVESALVRKFLDRLVGYRTSKMAAAVVPGRGASMGRVQTPTLGFVVERELEREAFVPTPYFEVRALAEGVELQVRFHEPDDPRAWRDEAGRTSYTRTFDGELARAAAAALERAGRVTLARVRSGTSSRQPPAPFSTDALLQEAGARLGWSPRKTSVLASRLYEEGHITYIRTDSTRLAAGAGRQMRELVREKFGEDHLGAGFDAAAGAGPVQDAHEAIRPTRVEVAEAPVDDDDARRLYRLVRARALASRMAPSRSASRSLEAACEGLDRPLTGSVSWRTFAGWEAAYQEFLRPRPTSAPDVPLEEGAVWPLDAATEERPNPLLVEDETRPPGRFRPHTLIKAMKDAGIGRPSTYSRTVEKLEERDYVAAEDGALVPTERGRTVWLEAAPLYAREADEDHEAAELFSTAFTALMEERLDAIERGEAPAPETWEAWRDEVRDLHEAARGRRDAGESTLRQRELLGRLLPNAPEDFPRPAGDPASLSYQEARELTNRLRAAGVQPRPSQAQLDLVERLIADLDLDEDELAQVVGPGGPEATGTSVEASRVIDELQRLKDERRPPSPRQRRYIDDLRAKAGLSDEEAAALVGAASLDELTGGREGTAGALIEELKGRVEAEGVAS